MGGSTYPVCRPNFESEEVVAAVNSSLDFWLTLGFKVESLK